VSQNAFDLNLIMLGIDFENDHDGIQKTISSNNSRPLVFIDHLMEDFQISLNRQAPRELAGIGETFLDQSRTKFPAFDQVVDVPFERQRHAVLNSAASPATSGRDEVSAQMTGQPIFCGSRIGKQKPS
jgi:hypothetical protein